jgi:hypothetical protein
VDEGRSRIRLEHRLTTLNTWYPILLADDSHASGDPLEPMEYCVTGSPAGTFTTNDEQTYAMARTRGVASFSARNPLSIAGMTVTIGGTTYYIGGVDIEHTRPRIARRAGSKFPIDYLNDGIENWKITLTRKYTDRVAWDLLKSGSPPLSTFRFRATSSARRRTASSGGGSSRRFRSSMPARIPTRKVRSTSRC